MKLKKDFKMNFNYEFQIRYDQNQKTLKAIIRIFFNNLKVYQKKKQEFQDKSSSIEEFRKIGNGNDRTQKNNE
ncbi:unnamed protein product [Paramecium pentaurelia]|uniref:Uncharacterized protein n=1 Tax=Paramecium pentaurelia TaxID=43138 RepID=A0A8S1UAU0_9CILI|nr:unnamed protein product [Paramecium pentaurelia]